MISLRCLGPIEVSVDGSAAPAELLWRKNLALLVYLARSPRGRTREHLVGALWPDKDDTKARHSLNEALRVLRRSLGSALVTEGETIRISPESVTSDTTRMEQLDAGALGLRFLEGFAVPDAPVFEDWLTGERQATQSHQLKILGARAEKALAEGLVPPARDLALAALRLDPQHEPSARIAMKAYALEGRRGLAIETFERLAAALDDIGIQPDGSTRVLADRIRTERIHPGAPSAERPEPPMVLAGGARMRLAALSELWAMVLRGSARAAVILGDPGTGKTRLAGELAGRARLDGAAIVRARAADGEPARETWAALLRGGLEVPELGGAAPPALASLAALDPDLATRFPSARGATPLPFSEALLAAVHAIADARPVLIELDDAHRAAPEVVSGLGTLIERSRDLSACLVVMAARGVSSAVDALAERVGQGRDVPGEVVATAALTEEEIQEVVAATFPRYSPAQLSRVARRVLADTAGNPFLAVELVRALGDGMNLPAGASAWPAARRTLDDTRPGDLPESVAAALRLRFRRLSQAGQNTLAAVAVLGGRAPAAVLARATELPVADVERALDELEWTRWLTGDSRGYAFATRIACEVVLSDMVTGGQQRRIRERAKNSER